MNGGAAEFEGANYGRVAHFYDKLEWLLGGVLERTRNVFLGRLPLVARNPIILACGTGRFPVAYVQSENPTRLTINDIAPEMLARARRRLANTGWAGELVVLAGNIAEQRPGPIYDFVSAQFFLDCFAQSSRIHLLRYIRTIMAPGAILLVSDYARPRAAWMLPVFYLNYGAALLGFWILARHAPNPPGDIERAILDSGFRILEKRTLGFGLFASWLAR